MMVGVLEQGEGEGGSEKWRGGGGQKRGGARKQVGGVELREE